MNLQIAIPKLFPCKFKCQYCIVNTHKSPKTDPLSVSQYRYHLLEYVIRNKKNITGFKITGENEPFQHHHQFPYIMAVLYIAQRFKIHVEVDTEGQHLVRLLTLATESIRNAIKSISVINLTTLGMPHLDKHAGTRQESIVDIVDNLRKLLPDTTIRLSILDTHYIDKDVYDYWQAEPSINQITIKQIQGNSVFEQMNTHENHYTGITYDLIEDGTITLSKKNGNLFQVPNQHKTTYIDLNCQKAIGRYKIFREDGQIYAAWDAMRPIKED